MIFLVKAFKEWIDLFNVQKKVRLNGVTLPKITIKWLNRYELFLHFCESIKDGKYTVEKGADLLIKVPGSKWTIIIANFQRSDLWFRFREDGITMFDFDLLENGQTRNFGNKGDFITTENADDIQLHLSLLLANITEILDKEKMDKLTIQEKLANVHVQTPPEAIDHTKRLIDPAIRFKWEQMEELLHHIEPQLASLSLEDQHAFERMRATDLPRLMNTFSAFNVAEQATNKASLFDALDILQNDLNSWKREILVQKNNAFNRSVEFIKQREMTNQK